MSSAVGAYKELPFKTKLLIQEINLINDLENEDNDFEDEDTFFNLNANSNSNELLYENNDSDNIYDEPTREYDSSSNVKENLILSKKKLLKMVHSSTGGSSKSESYYYENSFKRILTPVDSFKRRSSSSCCSKTPNSILYSPMHNHHHHLNLNHHTGSSNLSTITNRPHSRNSLNSRLSSSHNSLSVPTANKADDSIFITQAMSHDALLGHDISDFYNVPLDSDMYALPIDVIKTSSQILTTSAEPEKITSTSVSNILDMKYANKSQRSKLKYIRNTKKRKRTEKNVLSVNVPEAASASSSTFEPMHMTLDEVKRYYHTLYSSSSDSSAAVGLNNKNNRKPNNKTMVNNKSDKMKTMNLKSSSVNNTSKSNNNNNKKLTITTKDECANNNNNLNMNHQNSKYGNISKKSQFSINLKQKFCSIFRFRKSSSLSSSSSTSATTAVVTNTTATTITSASASSTSTNHNNNNNNNHNNNLNHLKEQHNKLIQQQQDVHEYSTNNTNRLNSNLSINTESDKINYDKNVKLSTRALPPLPGTTNANTENEINPKRVAAVEQIVAVEPKSTQSIDLLEDESLYGKESTMDFATNIEKVKDFGWYWGPISSDGAEKILSTEPDGSFIVRDSSDDHFIFSLTFKLNGCVRHVRIDQDQGTFSFGSCAKFKSRTIMEFIENAVEHSRSGRYILCLIIKSTLFS